MAKPVDSQTAAAGGVVVLIVAFLALILIWSCFSVVPPGHRGVRVTMGKVAPEALSEGVAFKWPLGISKIEEVEVRQKTEEGKTPCFSSDLQTVEVEYAIMYKVVPTRVVDLFQNYRGEPFDVLIKPRLAEALKQSTAAFTAEQLVQKREVVREDTRRRLAQAVGENIEIIDVNLTNIDLSDQVERAIESKVVEQQVTLRKESELNTARKEAEISRVVAQAEADAVRLRAEAYSNPIVLQMEIVKKWNGVSPAVVVTGGSNGTAGTANAGGSQIILPLAVPAEMSQPTPQP